MRDKPRIFGIDWLEMFVSESPSVDYSAEGFRNRGFIVQEREYGTKTMAEMFTLYDQSDEPMIEIRRAPRGLNKNAEFSVYTYGDAYVRITNKYCYIQNPMRFMLDFLESQHYTVKKIYRIDIFTDFERFDTGDIPQNVMRRIVTHAYSKVNQSHRRTSGEDTWTQCLDNWIAWGAPGSMVSTKFYNKTKEIRDTGMKKTWILTEWLKAGYIDSMSQISRQDQTVDMWRLEFSIKGSAKRWIYVRKDDSEDGQEHYIEHHPACYSDPHGVLNALANLIPYYFKFRIYREGVRKSNCEEKKLFDFSDEEIEMGYRLTNESDAERIRQKWVEEDNRVIRHLWAAYKLTKGTSEGERIAQLINEMQTKVAASVDAARDYQLYNIKWPPKAQ